MHIEYDQDKRDVTLRERGLDFADAAVVFAGPTADIEDTRQDYGEKRINCYGVLSGRMVVLVWTPRGDKRRIISMRYANEREKKKYERFLG